MAEITPEQLEEFQKPIEEAFGGQVFPTIAPPEPVFIERQGFFRNVVDIAGRTSTASFLSWMRDNYFSSQNNYDPSFDLKSYLENNPEQQPYAHIFLDAKSESFANSRWQTFKRNLEADQRIADSEAFWSRMATDLVVDPINFVPGTAVIRRGVGVINGVVRGAGAALPSSAVDAAIRLKYDPNATFNDVSEQMLYSTALTSILGGGIGLLKPGRTIVNISKDMIDEGRTLAGDPPANFTPKNPADESPVILHTIPHDATGSYRPYEALPTGDMPTGFAKAFGFEKIAAQQSEFARLANKPYRAVEDLANRMAGDYGVRFARAERFEAPEPSASLAQVKHSAAAGDAISIMRNFHARHLTGGSESLEIAGLNVRSTLAGVSDTFRGAFNMQRLDNKLPFSEFAKEVFKAHRADRIEHPIPEVEEAAKAIRPFFDNMLQAQLKSGYIPNPTWATGHKARLTAELSEIRQQIQELQRAKETSKLGVNRENASKNNQVQIDRINKELEALDKDITLSPDAKNLEIQRLTDEVKLLNEELQAESIPAKPLTKNQEALLVKLNDHVKLVENELNDVTAMLYTWKAEDRVSGQRINPGVTINQPIKKPSIDQMPIPDVIKKNIKGPLEKETADAQISITLNSTDNGNTTPVFFMNGRIVAIVDINGVKQPFYISTGSGGKADYVPPGTWQPFFGYGPDDAWLNKGSKQDIIDFYGSQKLRDAADLLNTSLGDMRTIEPLLPMAGDAKLKNSWMYNNQGIVNYKGMFDYLNPVNFKNSGKSTNITDQLKTLEAQPKLQTNVKTKLPIKEAGFREPANANFEPFTGPEKYYLPRIFLPEQVNAKADAVRKTMIDWYSNPENYPNGIVPKRSEIVDRVDSEMMGMMKLGTMPGSSGSRPSFTRSRSIDSPNEVFADLGVIDMDVSNIMQFYARRAGMGLEYARAFGNPNAELAISRAGLRVAEESKGKTADDILKEIDDIKAGFENIRDIQLGTIFAENADSIGRRSSSLIRSWFAVTSMGGALFNSLMETVRPAMVLGIKNNFDFALKSLGNVETLKKMSNEQRTKLTAVHELSAGQTFRRFFDNGIEAGAAISRTSKMLEKIEGPLSYLARTPLYALNGVGITTHYQKQFTGFLISDMFAERIMRVGDNTASKKDALLLIDYGISLDDARKMATMPIEKDKGIIFANTAAWPDQDLADKFYQAVSAVQDRVITTPSVADKPSVMMGVIGRGATRKEVSMLAVPFQLKSWGFAANNKIVLSALQGRDASVMAGILALFGAGYLVSSIKTPEFVWDKMTAEERILVGLEASGVFGLYGDLNFMMEQMSQDSIGLRPMMGMNPKRGPSDEYDALGEAFGPGPSKMLDIYKSFSSPYATSRDRANSVIRAIPFNNLIWIPRSFRTLARDTIEDAL